MSPPTPKNSSSMRVTAIFPFSNCTPQTSLLLVLFLGPCTHCLYHLPNTPGLLISIRWSKILSLSLAPQSATHRQVVLCLYVQPNILHPQVLHLVFISSLYLRASDLCLSETGDQAVIHGDLYVVTLHLMFVCWLNKLTILIENSINILEKVKHRWETFGRCSWNLCALTIMLYE